MKLFKKISLLITLFICFESKSQNISDYDFENFLNTPKFLSEYGFFNTTKIRSSKDGDFLTSPEVSNYFGLFINLHFWKHIFYFAEEFRRANIFAFTDSENCN